MLVYLAVLMPVLLLFCGIAVDVGQLETTRLQMQSASDAAALGGAQELERGLDNYVTDAEADAGSNGFTNGAANTTVTVAQQPTYGAYAGFYDAVQATITQQVPLRFLGLLGSRFSTVTARSTALVAPCAYVTGAAGLTQTAVTITGSNVSATCPWYVNRSVSMDSNSTFSALAENVTGTAAQSTFAVSAGSSPRYNAETHSDPLASLTPPTAGSCSAITSISGSVTLSPGTYCGLSARCNSTCWVTLQPGMYIFAGGLTAVNTVFNGVGVNLYFTRQGNTFGKVTFSTTGNGNYCLIYAFPPTDTSTGGMPGIVVMNDRSWRPTSAQDFTFTSSSGSLAGIYSYGIVYLTGTGIAFNNGSLLYAYPGYLGLDVDNLVVSNSTVSLRSDFSSVSGGSPLLPQGGLVQ